jgi:hypothetical protein
MGPQRGVLARLALFAALALAADARRLTQLPNKQWHGNEDLLAVFLLQSNFTGPHKGELSAMGRALDDAETAAGLSTRCLPRCPCLCRQRRGCS